MNQAISPPQKATQVSQDSLVSQTSKNAFRKKQWFSFILAFLVFVVIFFSLPYEPQQQLSISEKDADPTPVSVVLVAAKKHRAMITALGEIKPRWQSEVRAFVRGKATFVSKNALAGKIVKEDELLATIDDTRYLAQLAEANNRLAAAKISLLVAQRESNQAKRNWQRSGLPGKPESPLAFHEPQLAAAKLEVEAAQLAVKDANFDLQQTKIKAPFDGVVISRTINPSETVEVGAPLFTLISNSLFEIPVKLNGHQWQLLGDKWQQQTATVSEIDRDTKWQARLDRAAGFIDQDTRQRTLFLVVDNTPGLIVGNMVRATIQGRQFQDLLRVPQSALTREGFIWLIDKNNQLQRWRAQVMFSEDNWSYIRLPEVASLIENNNRNNKSDTSLYWQVVVTPQESFLPGAATTPESI
ncbi:MAG: efflux RND transporter periplasmic adaptor subunit [Kangiellaceae bacterium]|nr:efflux RND transporter periplasmic adaptor subunit [Kangiellaceae bacterium]MCW9000218.1 efflux RND transporter periplasmic adaptor subunit [Kangiellaceae bacterium]